MIEIYSERLKLIPLDHQLLSLWKETGRNAMEEKLGLKASDWIIEDFFLAETIDALENFWLPMTSENPDTFFWCTNWEIVLADQNLSIGGIGLAGLPDQEGVTMIGYFIDKNFREKGYASEALNCLINWASLEPSLKTIIADTPFFNLPSQNVLKKAGFREFGIGEVQHIEKMQVKHWKLPVRE
ncbi:Acetyltransferase (GNAT) domain-containing protein [Pseudarcicella hirudinis]|uniref:Acetyltransferase (GNAT) domain-containing protein n=1 Tax=Pseudarcicella hirudinis TaxID=1079859 RepID=A0A1I5YKK5_9BACT|nr:GNAT family N-acetyltransferase [Pseudarcicella hirudinis]SFQ44774.1 Acetyltransferase (GNAT) domain-containing protein [Pseudarcicella hirudinis]